jgi:hypothetical protein
MRFSVYDQINRSELVERFEDLLSKSEQTISGRAPQSAWRGLYECELSKDRRIQALPWWSRSWFFGVFKPLRRLGGVLDLIVTVSTVFG